MGEIKIGVSWNAFGGKNSVVLSPTEFRDTWLWGIPTTSINGQELTDAVIISKIVQAQAYAENYMGVKLWKQYMEETQDFLMENFRTWGYIQTNWPISDPAEVVGRLNEKDLIHYPKAWLTVRRGNDPDTPSNNLYIVPNGSANVTLDFLAVTYSQWFSFGGARMIPNYWQIKYVTGFGEIPQDVIRLIGLMAVVDILLIIELGVGMFSSGGASFGMASTSLSLDGLSQSVSKMNGGNIFQQRIKQHVEEIKSLTTQLRLAHGGIKFTVC